MSNPTPRRRRSGPKPEPTVPPDPVYVSTEESPTGGYKPARNGPIPTDEDDPSSLDYNHPPPPAPPTRTGLRRSTSLKDFASKTRSDPKEPINAYLIRRSDSYKAELPLLHGETSQVVREFFLNTILPISAGLNSGLADAMDIVRLTTSEDPSSNTEVVAYKSLINHLVKTALRVKTASFISSLTELSPREDELFTLIDFAVTQGGSNASVEEIVRKLFPVSDVPRQPKDDSQALVRKVHPDKRSRQHLRADPDKFVDSKGREL